MILVTGGPVTGSVTGGITQARGKILLSWITSIAAIETQSA